VELIAANSNIIASGDSILKDLLPTANEDYNFEIKLSGQGGGGVLQSSGIIDDVDALKGIISNTFHKNKYAYLSC
jgi:hypothetical protein